MFGKKSDAGYKEILPGIIMKTINYGKDTLMTEVVLNKGSSLPDHSHVHEQTGYLVKGRMKLSINGSSRTVTPGDSWNVPPNVRHQAEILEDSIAIEVFSPRREEYLKYVNEGDIVEQTPDGY